MSTMKRFLKYLILLIVAYIIVNLLIAFGTHKWYKDFTNYQILSNSPVVTVEESKIAKAAGYLKGTVENDTGKLINKITVMVSFYDENGNGLGNKTHEIKYFNVGEKAPFEIEYSYENVEKIEISTVIE